MSQRSRGSLRARWTSALLLVALVPLGLVAFVSVRIQRSGLARAEKELEVAVVAEAAASVDDIFKDAAEATHRVGRSLADGRIPSDDARLELALEALARSDVLDFVAIYDAKGELLDSIRHKDAPPGEPPPSSLPVAVTGSTTGKWVDALEAGGEIDLRYIEPMQAAGKVSGWVAGHVARGSLSRRIGQISQDRFANEGRVLLVDSHLRVIASKARGALAPGQDLTGQDIFASASWAAGASWAKDFGMTTEFDDPEQVRMVGTLRTLPERNWAVIARRPESEAFAALTDARRAFEIASAVVAMLAVLAGAWIARRTTVPIGSLITLARAYGRRDFEAKSDVKTGDELEELGSSLVDMAGSLAASEEEIARRATVEAGLSRYLPAEVARSIASGVSTLALGGERKEISVLFADVAGFTKFSEHAPPERVVRFLNELFSILSEVVFRHGGMVDKFIGDCIMAVFTEPTLGDARGHAERAVAAAEDIHRFVETQASAWRRDYDFDVQLGIGVASGAALVGNLGSDARMEYTAIGDIVNVASRLEGMARPGQTLVTVAVSSAASDAFQFTGLGRHTIRGKSEPVEVFELAV